MNTPAKACPDKTLIVFATRWGTQFGGINSFNQDLLCAFAAAYHQQATTVCVVPMANAQEQEQARNQLVQLVSLGIAGDKFPAELEGLAWQRLQEQGLPLLSQETVWLGHDRITGTIALKAAEIRGGRAALIHHMSYTHYESFAENSATAKAKALEQKELFQKANIAIAIGPLLADALADMRGGGDVYTLIPGLPEITTKTAPKTFKGFISGRLSEDARRIKQGHLGVAAFADAIRQADANPGLPKALRGENEPMLTLRGVDFEKSNGEPTADAELELKRFAAEYAQRAFNLHALQFTTDRRQLYEDLRSASVAMMPSWHEGFGLVAWEAIAAGVPLIVSNKSGVFRFIKTLDDGLYENCVKAVDVAGSHDTPFFQKKDIDAVASTIIQVAQDQAEARQKAARLREALSGKCTWANSARQLAEAFEWPNLMPSPEPTRSTTVPNVLLSAPLTQSAIEVIDLPRPRWRSGYELSDSQLLRAEEAIIPFDSNRDSFLTEQVDWAVASEYLLAVRLLTGAGGVGKTRLALELCRRLQNQGWHAGFLHSEAGITKLGKLAEQITGTGQPCCIVIDYAETRQPELLTMLKTLLEKQVGKPVRILLLARAGGDWWSALPAKDPQCEMLLEGSATSGPYLVPHLHDSGAERRKAYQLALKTFAEVLGVSAAEHAPDLSDEHFAHPLHLQMAALLSLRGERPQTAEALKRTMVSHERRYWSKVLQAESGNQSEHEQQAALLMTLATLANSIPTDRSIESIWSTLGEHKQHLRRAFKALTPLYPGQQGLMGLRPDLIGEALVAQSLLSDIGPLLLITVLTGEKNLRLSSLTVLARLLRNRSDLGLILEDALSETLPACIKEVMDVSIETPSCLPEIAERAYQRLSPAEQLRIAGSITARVEYEVLPLTGLGVLAGKAMTAASEKKSNKKPTQQNKSEHARNCVQFAMFLARNGNMRNAFAKSKEAVCLYQELMSTDLQRFKPELAGAFNNHASFLAEQGQYSEALQCSSRALAIYEALAEEQPERFKPDQANALHNHANLLAEQGQYAEASQYSSRALAIYGALTEEQPERFKPYLADALHNHAVRMAEQGQHAEASQYSSRALAIYEALTEERPERFKPDLASALHNHANRLAEEGQHAEALQYSIRALAIHETLAAERPERFNPDLADALHNHAVRMARRGHHAEPSLHSSRALAIYETLAEERPKRFNPDLAKALHNHAVRMAEQGQHSEALQCSRRELAIYEALAEERPERFKPDLAAALYNHSNHLAGPGQYAEALECSDNALAIYEALTEEQPERFKADLADARHNHANHLAEQGQYAKALECSTSGLATYEALAAERPERFKPDLAEALYNHSVRLAEQGQYAEASECSSRALELYKTLAESSPETHLAGKEHSRIWHAILQWLNTGTWPAGLVAEELPETQDPRKQRELELHKSYVSAWFKQEPAAIQQSLDAWSNLHQGQQKDWANAMFMLVAMANHSFGRDSLPEHWHAKTEAFRQQRQSNLPCWMKEMAHRAGFELCS